MSEEIKDSFTRLKELADNIKVNIKLNRLSLAAAQANKLIADLDLLESEIEFNEG